MLSVASKLNISLTLERIVVMFQFLTYQFLTTKTCISSLQMNVKIRISIFKWFFFEVRPVVSVEDGHHLDRILCVKNECHTVLITLVRGWNVSVCFVIANLPIIIVILQFYFNFLSVVKMITAISIIIWPQITSEVWRSYRPFPAVELANLREKFCVACLRVKSIIYFIPSISDIKFIRNKGLLYICMLF